MPATFDPTAAMVEAAAKHKACMWCSARIEPIDAKAATAYNLICMAYPDGRAPARYRRTHPNGPWIYTGGTAWEFQYVPGDEFPVFDTVHGKVGLAMCSEVYVPEVARALALRGAELIFMPAGKDKQQAVGDLAHADLGARDREPRDRGDHAEPVRSFRARARHGGGARGDPVREHGRRHDRGRREPRRGVSYLRATRDEVGSSDDCAAKQGLLGPQWQRPELYDLIHPRPLREAAE